MVASHKSKSKDGKKHQRKTHKKGGAPPAEGSFSCTLDRFSEEATHYFERRRGNDNTYDMKVLCDQPDFNTYIQQIRPEQLFISFEENAPEDNRIPVFVDYREYPPELHLLVEMGAEGANIHTIPRERVDEMLAYSDDLEMATQAIHAAREAGENEDAIQIPELYTLYLYKSPSIIQGGKKRNKIRKTRKLRKTKGGNSNVVVATSNGKVMSKNAFNKVQNRLYQEPY
jgi:hypothetical protein